MDTDKYKGNQCTREALQLLESAQDTLQAFESDPAIKTMLDDLAGRQTATKEE